MELGISARKVPSGNACYLQALLPSSLTSATLLLTDCLHEGLLVEVV